MTSKNVQKIFTSLIFQMKKARNCADNETNTTSRLWVSCTKIKWNDLFCSFFGCVLIFSNNTHLKVHWVIFNVGIKLQWIQYQKYTVQHFAYIKSRSIGTGVFPCLKIENKILFKLKSIKQDWLYIIKSVDFQMQCFSYTLHKVGLATFLTVADMRCCSCYSTLQ